MITYNLIISALLLFLSSTILALPSTPSSDYDYTTNNITSIDTILPREEGPKTYCRNWGPVEDQTSDASPYSVDCKQISINIRAGGSWEWGTGPKQKIVAKYGTCLVGLDGGDGVLWGNWLKIGNQDVVHIIEETLKLPFYNGEKVGSKGTTECRTTTKPFKYFKVRWGVWHT